MIRNIMSTGSDQIVPRFQSWTENASFLRKDDSRKVYGDDYDATSEKWDRDNDLDDDSHEDYTFGWKDKLRRTVWLRPDEYLDYMQTHHSTQTEVAQVLAEHYVGKQAYVIINENTGRVVDAERSVQQPHRAKEERIIIVYVKLSQEEEDQELFYLMPRSDDDCPATWRDKVVETVQISPHELPTKLKSYTLHPKYEEIHKEVRKYTARTAYHHCQ